jgi:UDP-N-acetylmuramate-alanine ligase
MGKFISKEENIEVVGNHGKTTNSALLSWCLTKLGEDVSYFIGEAPSGLQDSIHVGISKYSVIEGDEHPTLGQEPGGKFMYHKPKHILFTSADWDHKNIYDTLESYLDVYKELFDILPEGNSAVVCLDGINVLEIINEKISKIENLCLYTLGDSTELFVDENDNEEIKEYIFKKLKKYPKILEKLDRVYYVQSIDYRWKPDETRFSVKYLDLSKDEVTNVGSFTTHLIGQIGVENSLACISRLHSMGFDYEQILEGISSFQGIKRRLELVYNKEYKVINDFAHSPIKIESTLKAVRIKYPENKIFVIFHVNQSALKEKRTFDQLRDVFGLADFVIIPKVIPDMKNQNQYFGKDYRDKIKEGAEHAEYLKPMNIYYAPLGVQIQNILEKNISKNDVILIMSTGNVEELINLVIGLRLNTNS